MLNLVTATLLGVTISFPAFASMGTLDCANSDGSLRRTEKEVWGENIVTWTFDGKVIDQSQIQLASEPVVVNEEVRLHPDLGEELLLENVQKVEVTLADQAPVQAFIFCKSLTYPSTYD